MKRGTPHHPKTSALASALGLELWGAVGVLESLWHFAQQYAQRGDVGRFEDAAIARAIGWSGDHSAMIRGLLEAGWLDPCPCHRLRVHDWPAHADAGVHNCSVVKTSGFLECYESLPNVPAMIRESLATQPAMATATATALATATAREGGTGGGDSSKPKEPLERFVQVFNRCYITRRGIPHLNPKARKRWAQLRTHWGDDRLCCLPLLAWVYDSIKGRRVQERKVSHLLHDGTDGAWDWGQLLEAADSACPRQGAECRRAWEIAKELELEDALGRLHFPRPEGLEAPADTRTQEEKERTFKALLKATLDHQCDEDYGDAARAKTLDQIKAGGAR